MSRDKPPLSPDKTSIDGASRQPPPSAAPFDRTIYGNPHGNSTASPPLRPFQPPPSAPAPPRPFEPAPSNPARTPAPMARPIADLQRTMIGMPSDLARALAQVRPPSPPPSAAAPQRIIQVGQPSVESTSARPPATGTPASPASAHLPAPSRPAEASSPPVTNSSRASSSPPPLRTRTSLENTEPERDHTLSPTRAKTSAKPSSIVASAEPPTAPAPSGDKFLATRLVSSERGAFVSKAEPISLSTSFDPNASSDARVSMVKARPVKKWPALSLIGLAVVAFGGVIAVRAPGLLPAPIAGWLMRAPAAAPASVPPPSAAVPSTPSPSEVLPPMAADAPPTPTASPDAPAQGERAQLEKQAIDLLIANDYSAARAVYEKLHALEPARPEYSALLDLLARELAPTCGGPGQAPCGAP